MADFNEILFCNKIVQTKTFYDWHRNFASNLLIVVRFVTVGRVLTALLYVANNTGRARKSVSCRLVIVHGNVILG